MHIFTSLRDGQRPNILFFRLVGMPVPMVDNLHSFNNETNTTLNFTTQSIITNRPVLKISTRSRSNTEKTDSGFGVSIGAAEDESDSDTAAPHPLQQERTRQKKFVKNFKHLQEEVVFHRKFLVIIFSVEKWLKII